MRNLNRNKRLVYFATRIGETPEVDEYDNETGDIIPIYSDPSPLWCNISAPTGEEIVQTFGGLTDYSRVICLSGAAELCPIDEHSVVWFDVPTTEPYNHIVVRKADTKNCVKLALREVEVT